MVELHSKIPIINYRLIEHKAKRMRIQSGSRRTVKRSHARPKNGADVRRRPTLCAFVIWAGSR